MQTLAFIWSLGSGNTPWGYYLVIAVISLVIFGGWWSDRQKYKYYDTYSPIKEKIPPVNDNNRLQLTQKNSSATAKATTKVDDESYRNLVQLLDEGIITYDEFSVLWKQLENNNN